MTLSLDGLDLLGERVEPKDGAPLLLPVDSIDEDIAQPRMEFDDEPLRELADTIRERGVRQPISVRPNPQAEGRWLVNFGARRLRASKLAGKLNIPAFVDHNADSYDQIIENEQREGLKPLELALFIQRRLAAGEHQAEIARRMGKSRQYVTMAMALIDAPDWLLAAYRDGKCRGLTELHELRKLAREHPQYVEAWVSDRPVVTREKVSALRADLSQPGSTRASVSAVMEAIDHQSAEVACMKSAGSTTEAPLRADSAALPSSARKPEQPRITRHLVARLDGAVVRIDATTPPGEPGKVFVRAGGVETARAVDAECLTLLGFSEG